MQQRLRCGALAASLLLSVAACDDAPAASEQSASAGSGAAQAPKQGQKQATPRRFPEPLDGAPLYDRYCALCHGKDGKGYAADNAPSLVNPTFLESATDSFIASSIREGRPGTAMAAYVVFQ